MDDISKILASLSEDDMNMLKNMADSFLGSGNSNDAAPSQASQQTQPAEQTASAPASNMADSLLGSLGGLGGLGGAGGLNLGPNELSMIMKMKSAMDKMNQNPASNKNTQLIQALKPHLSEKRSHRADEAMQLMRMMDMLPLLKELF